MNHRPCLIAAAALTAVMLSSLGCDRHKAPKTEAKVGASQNQLRLLAQKHGAVSDWIRDSSDIGRPLTVDYQDAIDSTRGQPVVFEGMLRDICRRGNRAYVTFDSFDPVLDALVELEIGEGQQQELLQSVRKNVCPFLLVVARLSRVTLLYSAHFESAGVQTTEDPPVVEQDGVAIGHILRGELVMFEVEGQQPGKRP